MLSVCEENTNNNTIHGNMGYSRVAVMDFKPKGVSKSFASRVSEMIRNELVQIPFEESKFVEQILPSLDTEKVDLKEYGL